MEDAPTASMPPDPDRGRDPPARESAGGAAGDQIGPYQLLELIGEGGFGSVWAAERRHPFTQRVAVKLIKPGRDTREVLARFEHERQTLAMLDHPHIAKVLDGGMTPAGRPYFAMEFVRGKPITEFCDEAKLPIRKRLELFLQVCAAVQHAHIKCIIHRDLKPSNILVALGDGDHPSAKVIDFGIAKALLSRSTGPQVFTGSGHLMGTPEYMSPEQADPDEHDIDMRSDVYSLGVVLYELLVGQLPFPPELLRVRSTQQIQRFIREVDPATPSQRVTSLASENPEVLARLSAQRGEQPARLAPILRRELEWIPLKAMRKDRRERYASVAELAGDVQAYLSGLPLLAAPESAGYRLRKYARRNAPVLAAAGGVVLVLSAGLVTTLSLWRTAKEQGARAERSEAALRISRDIERTALEESEAARRDAELRVRQVADAEMRHEGEYVRAVGAMARLTALERRLKHISPSADRMLLLVDGRWALRDVKSEGVVQGLSVPGDASSDCCWSPDGSMFALVGSDGSAHLYEAAGAQLRWKHVDPSRVVQAVQFTADGSRIVCYDAGNRISLRSTEAGALDGVIDSPAAVVAMQTDARGELLLAACGDWRLRTWNLATRELLLEASLARGVVQMGRVAGRVLGLTRDGEIVVFEDSGRSQRVIDREVARVSSGLVDAPRMLYSAARPVEDEQLNASLLLLGSSYPDILEYDEPGVATDAVGGARWSRGSETDASFGWSVASAILLADREIADSLARLVRIRLQTGAHAEALMAAQQLVDVERMLSPNGGLPLAEALALRASAREGLRQSDEALADAKEALEQARRWSTSGGPELARFERLVEELEGSRPR